MKRNESRIGNLFKKKSTDFTSTTDDEVQVVNTCAKPPFVISEDVLDAEIIWCLHLVQSHQSYRSCNPLPSVFRRMFKICPVAQQFNMKKDKVKYMVVYGLYPALKAKQQTKIHASPWFSVSFDESLNRHQQKCQMDVNIRYCDGEKNVAQSVYYDSRFILRPNAVNLKEELLNAIKNWDMGKFLPLGVGGPSTNRNLLDFINDNQVAKSFQKTLDISCCSLHILHGAFQTGIMKPGLEIGKILKALYKLFNESPAHRDIYLHEGTSEVFPMKFCSTRWIEDQPVADRALEVWSSVVSTVKHCQSLSKSK